MSSWDLKDKGKKSYWMATLFLFLLFSVVLIRGDALADPLATCDTLSDQGPLVVYWLKSLTVEKGGIAPCTIFVCLSSWPDSVQRFETTIHWLPGDMELDSVDYSPWLQNHPGSDTETVTLDNVNGTVRFLLTGFDERIYSDELAVLNFRTKCFSSTPVFFVKECDSTHFGTQGNLYLPYPGYIFNSYIALKGTHSMSPEGDSSIINDTLIVPVMFQSESQADEGFACTWEYPKDDLDYLDVQKGPALGSWVTLSAVNSEESDPATILIYTDDSVLATPDEGTLFYIRLINTMDANYAEATVVRKTDTLKVCNGPNTDLVSIITTPDSATVTTYYEAGMKFKRTSAFKNTNNVDFPVRLSNNFWVQLKDQDTVTTFRIDNTNWDTDIVEYDSYEPYYGDDWKWYDMGGTGNRRFSNHEGSPQNIDISSIVRDVFISIVDAGSTVDSQVTYILVDGTKLKDANSDLTIYANTGIDLDSAYFVVKQSGGGPGCPFVYVWNGSEFEEDNTILTASEIAPGTPITDYYLLSRPLLPAEDEYRLQIKEFENEVSYLDRIKLVAVDHSPEIKVAVTPQGKIFGYDKELTPIACIDQNDKSHLSEIKSKDGVYFVSEEPGYLIVTYSRRTTGTEGSSDPQPIQLYDAAPGPGPPPNQKKAGVVSNLIVEIQDIYGTWHKLGEVPPRFYPERSFSILQVEDVELAEEFDVKISWDSYYSADELKYYILSTEEPVSVWSRPVSAVYLGSRETLKELLDTDEEYATLMPGQTIELSFPVTSNIQPDMVRDFVLQTTGYYISLSKPAEIPKTYALLNNYPNPFNANTVILYSLPEDTDVRLEVYNILGQKVKVLVNEHQTAGRKNVVWDGRNDRGETVSSGIYFYKLETKEFSDSKKMLMLK